MNSVKNKIIILFFAILFLSNIVFAEYINNRNTSIDTNNNSAIGISDQYFTKYQNYIQRITYLMEKSQYKEALKLLQTLENEYPFVNDYLYLIKGRCYYEMDDYKSALLNFENIPIYLINKQDKLSQANIYNMKANCELNLKEYNKAITDISKSIEIIPKPEYYVLRAVAYSATFQYELAKNDCLKIKQLCLIDKSDVCQRASSISSLILSDLTKLKY